MREGVVTFAQVIPIFAVVAYLSSLEKALVASTIIWSIWVAVSARKDGWRTPGFWWVVFFVSVANCMVVWFLPLKEPFSVPALAVAYP